MCDFDFKEFSVGFLILEVIYCILRVSLLLLVILAVWIWVSCVEMVMMGSKVGISSSDLHSYLHGLIDGDVISCSMLNTWTVIISHLKLTAQMARALFPKEIT